MTREKKKHVQHRFFFNKCRITVMEGWYKGERFAFKKNENSKPSGHPDRSLQEELSSSSKAAGRFPSYSKDIVFSWNQHWLCKTQQCCGINLFHVDSIDLNINSSPKNTLIKISRRYLPSPLALWSSQVGIKETPIIIYFMVINILKLKNQGTLHIGTYL